MDAYDASVAIEEQTLVRVREIYTAALRRALKQKKAFLQKVDAVASGKTKPPAIYVAQGDEAVQRWKQGFIRVLTRQEKVIEGIIAELNKAGVEAADVIRGSMAEIYQTNLQEATELIRAGAGNAGVNMTFAQPSMPQIRVILQEQESPMSRIAYNNLGNNPGIRRALQNELALSAALGEGQEKLVRRIMKVALYKESWQARRTAQTERTRVQSQARWEAGEQAKDLGVGVYSTWSTRMINSRETHISLNGKKAMQGDRFVTSAGNALRYPGDPEAPAREVINCHCVLVPGVLLPGERLPDDTTTLMPPTWEERYKNRLVLPVSSLINGLPIEADPYSIADKLADDGHVLQRRIYGANGKAQFDYDTTDHRLPHAHPTGAHKHVLDFSKRNPHGRPRKYTKTELERNADIIIPGVNYFAN